MQVASFLKRIDLISQGPDLNHSSTMFSHFKGQMVRSVVKVKVVKVMKFSQLYKAAVVTR